MTAVASTSALFRCTRPTVVVATRYTRRINVPPPFAVHHARTPPVITPDNANFVRAECEQALAVSPLVHEAAVPRDDEWRPESKRSGLLVRKIGVLPQWLKDGTWVTCTMLQVLENYAIRYVDPETYYKHYITGKRKAYGKHGAFGRMTIAAEPTNPNAVTRGYADMFAQVGLPPLKYRANFSVSDDAQIPPGTRLFAEHFKCMQFVDITGKTIDWGFEGVVHRWGFRGGRGGKWLGVTKNHRRPGAIGTSGDAMVKPGKKMPGHMGAEWRATRGVQVMRINRDKQVLYVRGGAVPGETGGILHVADSWIEGKRVQSPPFPTYYPAVDEDRSDEYFHDNLFRFTEPSIAFESGDDDAYTAAMRRAAVKKQAKAKRK